MRLPVFVHREQLLYWIYIETLHDMGSKGGHILNTSCLKLKISFLLTTFCQKKFFLGKFETNWQFYASNFVEVEEDSFPGTIFLIFHLNDISNIFWDMKRVAWKKIQKTIQEILHKKWNFSLIINPFDATDLSVHPLKTLETLLKQVHSFVHIYHINH